MKSPASTRKSTLSFLFWTLILFLSLIMIILAAAPGPARAASSTLVVSELLYDHSGSEPDGEWIEIYNLSDSAIDLSNYKVGDEETAGGGEGMLQFPGGSSIAAGQVVVIANRATTFASNWGFNPDYEINDSDSNVPDMLHYANWASGSVFLANSSDEVLILDGNDALVDAVSWGSSTFAFDPPAPDVAEDHSLERNPADADTDTAGDWIDQSSPDPGNVVLSGGGSDPTPTPTPTATSDPSCSKSDDYLAVWEIQGSGHTSPYDGQSVNNVRGIVTADFQEGTGGPFELWGFFIQAHETDCDAATSDGVFVYTGSTSKNISVGDLVEIDGASVVEYQGPSSFTWELTLTEVECRSGCQVSTLQSGYGLPPVEEYDPPTDDASALDYNESLEGMLVEVTTDATVIAPANQYNEFIVLRGTGHDRLHRDDPDKGHRVMVDGDGVAAAQCGQDGFGYIKTFDTINYDPANGSSIYGPFNYNFNMYKVQQDDDTFCISHTAGDDSSYDPADNPAPAADASTFTIAGLNAWNFFDTSDDPEKSDSVPTQEEYDRNSLKRAAAVCDADGLNRPLVVGLQEVENDVVLQKLVDDISATCGESYNYHTLAGPDDRSIEAAFLTRADRVTVLAYNDRQGCSSTNWGVDYENGDHPADVSCGGDTPYFLFNRPPLHLEVQINLDGSDRLIHVINNHFKSKLSSSSCSISDCTDRRVEQAQHVDNLVDDILANDPNANVIVMGDLNDFYNSDPLDVLDKTGGVLTNVWDDKQGPPSSGQGTITRYSYIFNGVSQTLDHLLISDALNNLARIVSPRHVNTDWPGSHVTDNTMFRSSDHDFLLVAFDFSGTGSGDNPPSASIVNPADGGTVSGSVTIQVDATDAEDAAGSLGVEVSIDGGAWQTAAYNSSSGYYELAWDTTAQSDGSHTIDARATDSAGNTTNASQITVTVDNSGSGGGDTMHVGDLDGNSINNGSTWTAVVTILVVDGSGNPVSSATIDGTWSNGASGTSSCTTDSNGFCDVSKGGIAKRVSSVTFTVDNITHSSLTYDASANTDPDGDSDGTSITLSKS